MSPDLIHRRMCAMIHAVRRLNGTSQMEFSRSHGISQSRLSKIENGILVPDAALWLMFCKRYGMDPSLPMSDGFDQHLAELNLKLQTVLSATADGKIAPSSA